MKVVLTGFEPFGGDSINPSWEAVKRLPERIGDIEVSSMLLPVEYHRVRPLLEAMLEREKPDAVICVGQAGGRAKITPEKVAINCMDARIPDAAGFQAVGEELVPGGPAAYFSTLPIKTMVARMEQAGVPAALSYTAGTYVCNATMYHLLSLAASRPGLRAGFVHIPFLCEQTAGRPSDTPSLPLATMILGLETMVRSLEEEEVPAEAAGTTH